MTISVFNRCLVSALLSAVPLLSIHAQVQVIDASVSRSTGASSSGYGTAYSAGVPSDAPITSESMPGNNAAGLSGGGSSGDLFNKILALEDEVATLRGIVEEQQNQIAQLKQQRLDDNDRLDRRFADMKGGGKKAEPEADSEKSGAKAEVALPDGAGSLSGDESADYKAAYRLVQEQNFKAAKEAFKKFLNNHPESSFASNAYFWLGGLHQVDKELGEAEKCFTTLLKKYPDSNKASEAMAKLGKVYHLQGDTAKAKKTLQQVSKQYPGTVGEKLAVDYLNKHFR